MPKILLKLSRKENLSYEINVKEGLLSELPRILKIEKTGNKYAIISDSTVTKLYGEQLLKKLNNPREKQKAVLITFSAGEKSKNFRVIEMILDELTKQEFNRNDAIIALGGGVTGDLAGFAASIYMRGIPYIQVPTTLLAMCDSSVGGKTGINLSAGKNLAGTFYQPSAVLIDTTVLDTLPETELLNGLAEAIKHGIIRDKQLFEYIRDNTKKILGRDAEALSKIIVRSCEIKIEIVTADEKEKGLRKILNYGHTIGHALEKISNHRIRHGQAVALGILLINKVALDKGVLNKKDEQEIKELIRQLKLTGKHIISKNPAYLEKLWQIILSDKKTGEKGIEFVFATEIGKTKTSSTVTKEDLKKAILNHD